MYETPPQSVFDENPSEPFHAYSAFADKIEEVFSIGEEEASTVVDTLDKHGLITISRVTINRHGRTIEIDKWLVTLTEKGFDVAHDRKIESSQASVNQSSARLSGFLVLAVGIQALAAGARVEGVSAELLVIVAGLVIALPLIEMHKSGLMDLGVGIQTWLSD